MTTDQKKTAVEVLTRFREQLANLRVVETEVVAPFTKRVQHMVDKRLSTRPPGSPYGEGATT